MRKTNKIISAISIALCLTSCNIHDEFSGVSGEMTFNAKASQALTRAQYSDVVGNIACIDWEKGDNISIYCAQAAENTLADYAVKSVKKAEDGSTSEADIRSIDDTKSLLWGSASKTHDVYAVFPSPATSLYQSDVFKEGKVTGYIFESQKMLSVEKVATGEYEAKPNLRSQYMVAKTSVKPSQIEKTVNLEFKPMTTAIEFEIQNDYSTSDPMNVAYIQLVSKNHKLNGLFSVDLTSWTPKDGLPATTSAGLAAGTPKVMLDFRSQEGGCLSLKRGEKLKFTFFLLPNEDIDDLAFMVVDPDGGYVATELAYSNDPTHGNAGVKFPRCKKSFVKGLLVPEGVRWTLSFTSDLSSWNKQDGGKLTFSNPEFQPINFVSSWVDGYDEYVEMDGMYEYNLDVKSNNELANLTYLGGEFKKAIQISSTRYNEDFPMSGADWQIEIYDKANSKWVKASTDASKNPKGTDWISFNRVSGNGNYDVNVTVRHGNPENKDELDYKYSTVAEHKSILRNRAEKGTQSKPWDLSAHDIYGNPNANGVETANCYVVNSAGWYAFPLVYGNGITKGAEFKTAYNPTYQSQGQRYLRQFQNAFASTTGAISLTELGSLSTDFGNGQIKSPYIENDISNRYDKFSYGIPSKDYSFDCHVGVSQKTPKDQSVTNKWTAFPLWQDTDSPIVTDDASNCYVISATEAANRGLALGGKCGYVVFHVNKDNLQQGNVLIGVRHQYSRSGKNLVGILDKDWDHILWSWHIWVTDEDLSPVSVDNGQGFKSKVLPINLGWVDGNKDEDTIITTSYKPLEAKIRIAQPRGNEPDNHSPEITIRRGTHQLSIIAPYGSSPYYQWGRPTPMPRMKTFAETSITDVNNHLIKHSGYSIKTERVANGSTPTGVLSETVQSRMGKVLRDPTSFYGSAAMEVGVALVFECYEQWFCEPFGSVGGLLLCTSYAPCNLWNAQCFSGSSETMTTIKTVYDPCPPGLCVPNGDSFNGLIRCNDGTDFSTHRGVNLYTSSDRDETIFMPAVGKIARGSLLSLEGDGKMLNIGTESTYWLSTGGASGLFTIASENNSHAIHIDKDSPNGVYEGSSRANGFCVRPQVTDNVIK